MDKQHIFIDFTRGSFGDHKYTEKLKELHKEFAHDLRHYTGCGACHKRRVTAKYRDRVFAVLNSE